MTIRSLSRRGLLKLGAIAITQSILAPSVLAPSVLAQGAQDPQPPRAPAQVPSSPQAPGAPPARSLPPAGTSSPVGTWRWLRSEYGDGSTVQVADPNKYTLSLLPDGRLGVQADCNRGGGSYTVNGAQLTLQLGPMTLIACGAGTQDQVFLRDLRGVATYVMDGSNLVLNMRTDAGNMVFEPQPAATLTGTPWRVTGVNNGRGGVASVVAGTELTASFGEDGVLTGNTGCNEYRGPYQQDGESVRMGPFASTRRACLSPEAGAQEQAFLTALASTSRIELGFDRLTLRNAAGATQVTMMRAPTPRASVTGMVTYRERIALPPNAVVQVSLQDVSRADAPATVLGEQTTETNGRQVPIPFEIAYDPARIDQRLTYAVRARITVDGQLLFTSTTATLVITQGRPTEVELVLQRV